MGYIVGYLLGLVLKVILIGLVMGVVLGFIAFVLNWLMEVCKMEKMRVIFDSREVEADDFNAYDFLMEDLDVELDNHIIGIVEANLWHGQVVGYKEYGSNLKSILNNDYDDIILYLNGWDLKMIGIHHDGRNYITFREVKNEDNIENFLDKVYSGKFTKKNVTYYTKSLKNVAKQIFHIE